MNTLNNKLWIKLTRESRSKLIVTLSMISSLTTVVFLWASGELAFIKEGALFTSDKFNMVLFFIITVILGPLFSTLIFQNGVIGYLNDLNFFKNQINRLVIASALVYALITYKNPLMAIYTFIVGCIFSYGYCISKRKIGKGYYTAVSIHMVTNLILFMTGVLK